jgi:chromosome segregation ATPase
MNMRDSYQRKLEAQLKEWAATIDLLKAKADKAEAEAKIEYHEELDELRLKWAAAQQSLRELKAAGDKAWDEVEASLRKAWAELKKGLDSAASKFK